MKVRGDHTGWSAYADGSLGLSWCRSYGPADGDSMLVGFGPSTELLDVTDLEQVRAVMARWRPELEILECTGHDWVADEFSRQAYLVQRPGQHRGLRALQRPEDGLFLVGSTTGPRGLYQRGDRRARV